MPDTLEILAPVSIDIIPVGRPNRPRDALAFTYITIHNTDNTAAGADAQAHSKFVTQVGYYMLNGQRHNVSWHFTVDDKKIFQQLPLKEVGWHAGPGNSQSIAIEICMNVGIDQAAANARAALLVAAILNNRGFPTANAVTHHHWTGKDCPVLLLDNDVESAKWTAFKALVDQSRPLVSGDLGPIVESGPAVAQSEMEVQSQSSAKQELREDDSTHDIDHDSLVIPKELLSAPGS